MIRTYGGMNSKTKCKDTLFLTSLANEKDTHAHKYQSNTSKNVKRAKNLRRKKEFLTFIPNLYRYFTAKCKVPVLREKVEKGSLPQYLTGE